MEERGGRIRKSSLNCVWEIDSQLNDSPILVTWLAASLGFPTIAHVIPWVSETKCQKPRYCAGWCDCRTSSRKDQVRPNAEVLIRREGYPPTGEHMSEVKFLIYIGGDHWAHSPVDPEPSLERQICQRKGSSHRWGY